MHDLMDDPELQAIYERNSAELFALANRLSNEMNGKVGRALLDARRAQCDALIDLLKGQKRDLDWRAGEHKPETLYGAVELEGKFGDIFPGLE